MTEPISLYPNYSHKKKSELSKRLDKICSLKFKKNKEVTNNELKFNTKLHNTLLDCNYGKEMLNNDIPEEWEKFTLSDFISNVYSPFVCITKFDVEDFMNDLDMELNYECNDSYHSEEDQE